MKDRCDRRAVCRGRVPFWPLAVLATLLSPACARDATESVEMPETAYVFVGATVWTGNPYQPFAASVAVRGDEIVLVGSVEDARAAVPGAEEIATPGGLIVPGFIDSHVHFLTGGYRLSSVQLRDAASPSEFIRRIGAYAETIQPGEWITGGDWDHERWGGELPDRTWIDSVTARNPVWVNRLDGHMALANSEALRIAGVVDPADIDGGTIVRSGNRLTGVLKDNAMSLVGRSVPEPSDPAKQRGLVAAMRFVASNGVTSVHDMDGAAGTFDALHALRERDSLFTRVYLAYPLARWRDAAALASSYTDDDWLRIGSVKGFVDGSLGSHTAAFFEPFDDAPGDSGFFVVEPDDLYADMAGADDAGLQLMIHAIGDRANATLLDLFGRLNSDHGRRDRRSRIEHAQHLRDLDIDRFSEYGVVASMQPYHAIDDGRWAEKVIGPDRARGTYAFRSLLDAGTRVAFGSDWFVAPPTPLDGIYAAVTRRTLDGLHPYGWVPEQRITVAEALAAYTRDAAYAEFQEDRKGTLEPGKLADLVILDRNLFDLEPERIRETKVMLTMVDGRFAFRAE